MSFNQWKIPNSLKDAVLKIANNKSIQNIFSRETFSSMQRLLPYLYNSGVFKYLEDGSLLLKDNEMKGECIPKKANSLKIKKTESSDQTSKIISRWKRNVPESTISSRTDQILQFLKLANSEESTLLAIERLIIHLQQYQEAKNKAAKAGAVRVLLLIRSKRKNELIQGAVREALAILGYADPVPGRGIRILSIDGGGIRALLVLEMLKKLEELTGRRAYQLFDIFCGVSTGAILSFLIGVCHHPLDEISFGYEAISREVFKQSSWRGTGSLVWNHSYYDTTLWEKRLKEHFGHEKLISTSRNPDCPKLCAVSAVVNQERLSAFVFRNYSLSWKFQSQYLGSYDSEIWQAVRASAAAPTYFEEFKLGNLLHQDGGILVNNPTAIALHESKLIWPNTPIQCVVSFGTGRTVPSPAEFTTHVENPITASNTTSWAEKFYKILDSATDTEAVHTMLNDLLPDNIYYRFNPYLTEMISMVETDSQKLQQLKRDAIMYLRRNEDKFHEVAKVLMVKRRSAQKINDFIKLQKDMFGF